MARAFPALALLCVLALPGAALCELSEGQRSRLLAELGDETAAVRRNALSTLESEAALTPEEVAGALERAPLRARPLLHLLAARRGMEGLVPRIADDVAAADPEVAEAAIRALVSLGEEAVAAGRERLALPVEGLDEIARAGRARHLEALRLRRAVEQDVVSRWRRKGGSYRGRYEAIAVHGWAVQPVLLAMLLDVPLEDHHVLPPAAGTPAMERLARMHALGDIARSRRRGYRTFDPLPHRIEPDDLFELAGQALSDVGDMDALGPLLEEVAERLSSAHDAAPFRLRPFEDYHALAIESVLAARGRPERLELRALRAESEVETKRRWIKRVGPQDRAYYKQLLASSLSDLAQVLHQLGRYDEAAETYEEVVALGLDLTGEEPAIAGYNRACALARAGRLDEAFEQLERALDPSVSSGSQDLTDEWVSEDGDLRALHDDPRFQALLRRRSRR